MSKPERATHSEPDNSVQFRLPIQGSIEDLATRILRESLDRAGIAQAIADATVLELALHGNLDKEGAAKFLRIGVSTLEEWMLPVQEGGKGCPYLKIGTRVLFRIASLEAWQNTFEVNKVVPKAA
jgi:hypothetical protein